MPDGAARRNRRITPGFVRVMLRAFGHESACPRSRIGGARGDGSGRLAC